MKRKKRLDKQITKEMKLTDKKIQQVAKQYLLDYKLEFMPCLHFQFSMWDSNLVLLPPSG